MEDFLRRYWGVLAVAIGILLALLALRALRRRISGVVPRLIGAVLVVLVAWLLLGLGSLSAPDLAPLSASDRAHTSTSVEWKVVRACGREFSIPAPQARSFVRSMEIDCGIFGPLPEDARDRRPYDDPY